ncbi:MAG: DUF167 family protein, partial [Alphaproteobacteria bacterium]
PNAACDQIFGLITTADGRQAIAARVRAVPQNGKANIALFKLLAKFLGVAKSKIEIINGTKNRLKTVRIAGDGAQVAARIAQIRPPETGSGKGLEK